VGLHAQAVTADVAWPIGGHETAHPPGPGVIKKASLAMAAALGMLTSFTTSALQSTNACERIFSSWLPAANVTLVSSWLYPNAVSPIAVTVLGIVMDLRSWQIESATRDGLQPLMQSHRGERRNTEHPVAEHHGARNVDGSQVGAKKTQMHQWRSLIPGC